MQQYLIFLRGVMPTGKNKVPMAHLREVLAAAGLHDVRTYIQSGNVLVRSTLDAEQVAQLVHDEIQTHFGGDLVVVARTPEHVRQIFTANPFPDAPTAQVYFTLLASPPAPERVAELAALDFTPEQYVLTADAVYVYCADGYGRTKLHNNYLEKMLKVSATTRNYNTMTKMLALSEATPD